MINNLSFKLLFILLSLFPSGELFARAGGGGGYSGGGGFSGGGGYSSGGSYSNGGDYSGSYSVSGVDDPSLAFMLLFFVFFLFLYSTRNPSRTIKKAFKKQRYRTYAQELAELKERDPGFSIARFEKRCVLPFVQIQQAWSSQNMAPVRAYISDGVYERFTTQIAMQKSSLRQNIMQDVRVRKAVVLALTSDEHFDTVHVGITAQAVDYTIHAQSKKQIHGSKRPQVFSEVWSYIRKPSAKTLLKAGLLEGKCPNCSARLKISDSVQCSYCDVYVNSGSYDWVLSEITQMHAFTTDEHPVANYVQMQGKDSAINKQHIEDKTSVVFWKEQAGRFYADDAHLKKYALNTFLQQNKPAYTAHPDGRHSFLADAAVGSVELLAFRLASDGSAMDEAHVRLKASGHEESRRVPSFYPNEYEKSAYKDLVYVLARQQDVKTPSQDGLSSLKCLSCGSPDRGENSSECAYCARTQNDGSLDWVLQEIQNYDAYTYENISATDKTTAETGLFQKDYHHREAIIVSLLHVMQADGTYDDREYNFLHAMAVKQDLSTKRFDELIMRAQTLDFTYPRLNTDSEKKEFLEQIIHMCLIDGSISTEERKILKTAASRLGYTQYSVASMIKKKTRELYQKAKET
jgi:uncharacterized tellurite resistance protein B-like protein